jgi:hypothetical protein
MQIGRFLTDNTVSSAAAGPCGAAAGSRSQPTPPKPHSLPRPPAFPSPAHPLLGPGQTAAAAAFTGRFAPPCCAQTPRRLVRQPPRPAPAPTPRMRPPLKNALAIDCAHYHRNDYTHYYHKNCTHYYCNNNTQSGPISDLEQSYEDTLPRTLHQMPRYSWLSRTHAHARTYTPTKSFVSRLSLSPPLPLHSLSA